MRKSLNEEGPDPIDRHVGTRIRGRRVGLRISQTKLGQAIGVTFQQIQKYESGTNRVGASNLFKISKALGVDVSFFFDGVSDEEMDGYGAASMGLAETPALTLDVNPMNSRESFELMHNYFRVPDPLVRKRLFQLVRTLAFSESEPLIIEDDEVGSDIDAPV
jgi:transcriptional regulator with XRE-family HTH domain